MPVYDDEELKNREETPIDAGDFGKEYGGKFSDDEKKKFENLDQVQAGNDAKEDSDKAASEESKKDGNSGGSEKEEGFWRGGKDTALHGFKGKGSGAKKWKKWALIGGFGGGGLGLLGILFAILFFLSPSYKVNATHSAGGIIVSNLVFPLAVVVFFFGLIMEKTVVRSILSTRAFQLLGKGSYAFFLVHTGVIANWVNENICKRNILLLYIAMYGIAILLSKTVEIPLNYRLRAFGNKLYQNRLT